MTAVDAAAVHDGTSRTPRALWITALACAGAGALATVPILPSAIRAVLMLGFIFAGPGSAVMLWLRCDAPTTFTLTIVPVSGLAVFILAVTGSVYVSVWEPTVLLLVLAALTALTAQVTWLRIRRSDVAA